MLCPSCARAITSGGPCASCASRGDLSLSIDFDSPASVAAWREGATLRELEQLAPAVATWLRIPESLRGPIPDVRPALRAQVQALLAELDRLAPRP